MLTQRERRQNNEDGNEHAHTGVRIVSSGMGCSEPDDQTGRHYTQVIDCVADNVDHYSHHAQITVVVAAMTMAVAA